MARRWGLGKLGRAPGGVVGGGGLGGGGPGQVGESRNIPFCLLIVPPYLIGHQQKGDTYLWQTSIIRPTSNTAKQTNGSVPMATRQPSASPTTPRTSSATSSTSNYPGMAAKPSHTKASSATSNRSKPPQNSFLPSAAKSSRPTQTYKIIPNSSTTNPTRMAG